MPRTRLVTSGKYLRVCCTNQKYPLEVGVVSSVFGSVRNWPKKGTAELTATTSSEVFGEKAADVGVRHGRN